MASILIIGCGAIGTGLAKVLIEQGHQVTGLKRHPPESSSDIQYHQADISSATSIQALDLSVDVVFFIVSADGRTEASYHSVYVDGLQNALAKFAEKPWFFVSSTSVYGHSQGEWVDEDSLTQPEAVTSQLICQAEQQVMAANPNNVVVRFSGIYGPGREYLLRMAKQNPVIQQTPPYFTNRIHEQDCIGVLAFLLQKHLEGVALAQCYVASDDDPAPLWEVMTWLTEAMACSPPSAKTVVGVADGNKRCRNNRLKALGYQFRYPSYRVGYAELIK